jgi:hypothetical protein
MQCHFPKTPLSSLINTIYPFQSSSSQSTTAAIETSLQRFGLSSKDDDPYKLVEISDVTTKQSSSLYSVPVKKIVFQDRENKRLTFEIPSGNGQTSFHNNDPENWFIETPNIRSIIEKMLKNHVIDRDMCLVIKMLFRILKLKKKKLTLKSLDR